MDNDLKLIVFLLEDKKQLQNEMKLNLYYFFKMHLITWKSQVLSSKSRLRYDELSLKANLKSYEKDVYQ